MGLDDITQRQNALIRDYCVSCNKPLPPRAVFCEHCGPPAKPEDIQKGGMSFGQAFKKIVLMTLVFAAILAYKADWDYQAFFSEAVQAPAEENAKELPATNEAEDYQLIHYVNVSFANIREKPDKDSKVIAGAGKGEHLIVLEKREHWTQIKLGDKTGWIATRLISTSIE